MFIFLLPHELKIIISKHGDDALFGFDGRLGAFEIVTHGDLTHHILNSIIHFGQIDLGYNIE